jgi:hypothetical protein
VGTYFAVVNADDDCAVWAIDWVSLRERVYAKYQLNYEKGNTLRDVVNSHHVSLFNRLLAERATKQASFLVVVEPERLSERMSRQQGVFAAPTNIEETFMENLRNAFEGSVPEGLLVREPKKPQVCKIVLPKKVHADIVKDLTRMNITSETLFPGLDGFARSLHQLVVRG